MWIMIFEDKRHFHKQRTRVLEANLSTNLEGALNGPIIVGHNHHRASFTTHTNDPNKI